MLRPFLKLFERGYIIHIILHLQFYMSKFNFQFRFQRIFRFQKLDNFMCIRSQVLACIHDAIQKISDAAQFNNSKLDLWHVLCAFIVILEFSIFSDLAVPPPFLDLHYFTAPMALKVVIKLSKFKFSKQNLRWSLFYYS